MTNKIEKKVLKVVLEEFKENVTADEYNYEEKMFKKAIKLTLKEAKKELKKIPIYSNLYLCPYCGERYSKFVLYNILNNCCNNCKKTFKLKEAKKINWIDEKDFDEILDEVLL